jgi:peptidoglycan hydrolase-like protein with peptidoglycan-binding domain
VSTAATADAARKALARRRQESIQPLLWLQRTAGNQAVATLVQRSDDEKKLLTSGQAARAVSFYRGRPDLYTPAIVTKIKMAVKSGVSGGPDAEMAEGVARFQSAHVLKVDGMAGPRTLPRLFESGLATEASRKEFVAAGKTVASTWQTLATPKARAAKLFEGVKALLDNESVFTPSHDVDRLGKAAGVFSPRDWKITFDRAALEVASADDDAVKDVAGTIYHEARHAEQNHKMARMRATKLDELGVSKAAAATRIVAEMRIPPIVAEDAVGKPLPHDVEFVTAAQQFDANYGAGRARHEQAEANVPSNAELQAAREEAERNPTAANRAKLARLTAAFKAYHNLPDEADAFATEIDFVATWEEETVKASD